MEVTADKNPAAIRSEHTAEIPADACGTFRELVANRYSCRAYDPRPVGREAVEAVLEAVRLAPSACNRQPWVFVVADRESDPALHDAVAAAYPRDWAAEAPVLIVACGDHSQAWHRASDGKDHTDVDVAIAMEHLCLAATSLGLGTCWICNFDARMLADALHCPEGVEPIAITPVGYPAPDSVRPGKLRKPLEEIVRWERF